MALSYAVSFTKAQKDAFSVKRREVSRPAPAGLQLSGKNWRTWIASSELGFERLEQLTKESRGITLERLYPQLNGQSALANADTIDYGSAKSNKTCFAKDIVQATVRTVFLIGLGLSVSLPASARTMPSSVSEVSAFKPQKAGNDVVEALKKSGKDVGAMQSQEYAPFERDESGDSDMSEAGEARLRLSDAFWRGLPTSDGSFLHSLKVRLSKNPSEVRALEALLQAVLEQKDMLRALTVVETLLEFQPNNLEWKFLKARTHELLGELPMAKEEYDELLHLHPFSARFLQGLVKILNEMGEQTQALELIKKALDQAISETKNMEARNIGVLLGQFYIQLGKFEDALHHLNSMIEGDPDDFRPYLCQGLTYTLMKETDKARQSFKKYMERCPPDALDPNHMDSLMLKVQASKQIDTLTKKSMKSSSRNMKKAPKPMQQPSVFGNIKSKRGAD